MVSIMLIVAGQSQWVETIVSTTFIFGNPLTAVSQTKPIVAFCSLDLVMVSSEARQVLYICGIIFTCWANSFRVCKFSA